MAVSGSTWSLDMLSVKRTTVGVSAIILHALDVTSLD